MKKRKKLTKTRSLKNDVLKDPAARKKRRQDLRRALRNRLKKSAKVPRFIVRTANGIQIIKAQIIALTDKEIALSGHDQLLPIKRIESIEY